MPHPPLAIPEIGQGKEREISSTIEGMEKIAREIKEIAPKTIVIISPHGNIFSDGLCINIMDKLSGNFARFRQPKLKIEVKCDFQKALILCSGLRASGINCLALDEHTAQKYDASLELDHGTMVPLYFIQKHYNDFKLLHINIGMLPKIQMYEAGKIMTDILGEECVIIASGDLSHRVSKEMSEEYDEMGPVYDKHIVNSINDSDFLGILSSDDKMLERAGQCAQKPLEMMIGAMDGRSSQGNVYSYEGPFGVGYLTAAIESISTDKEHLINQYLQIKKDADEKKRQHEDEYVTLARDTIHYYIKNGKKPEMPENLAEDMYIKQSGVFVSIKREGMLRGCIGTMIPTKSSIAEEIIDNAIEAATNDDRFSEIGEVEFDDLEINVDILSALQKIKSVDELDINRYGIVVSNDSKTGLLLPNIDGVKDVNHQVAIALEKAGIKDKEEYSIHRFMVERHKRLA